MPELKEPRYFASDLRSRFGSRPPDGAPRLVLPETLDEYLALFAAARAQQRVGESSPSYLRSHTAAGLIAEAQPAARIIAVLREPASFLRSMHLELVQNHVEREQDLRRALANETRVVADDGLAGDAGPASASMLPRYTDRVRYVDQLRRYHAVFAREQVLTLIYDDFRADNAGTMRKVLRFLNVDDSQPVASVEANPTVKVRSLRLDRWVRALYAGQGPVLGRVKRAIKTVTPARLHGERLNRVRRRIVYGRPPPPDEELMLELRRRFKPEVVALSDYLERDLVTQWGYDRID
jgi:hypothetical protein